MERPVQVAILYRFLPQPCISHGVLVPQKPGIEPVTPALEVWSLNYWIAREVTFCRILTIILLTMTCLPWGSFHSFILQQNLFDCITLLSDKFLWFQWFIEILQHRKFKVLKIDFLDTISMKVLWQKEKKKATGKFIIT